MMREKRKIKDREKEKEKQKDNNNKLENVPVRERARLRGKKRHGRNKEIERDRERVEREKVQEKHLEVNTSREMAVDQDDKNAAKHVQNGTTRGPESINISTTSTSQTCEIHSSGVMILEGHTSMVCACAWSPTGSLLASGSEDSTALIWRIGEGAFRSGAESGPLDVFVLRHVEGRANEKNKYITTLDWNSEGTLLATGSFDGHAMVWSTSGEQKATLSKHKGPVLSLKWNKKGNYLLSGAADKKVLVWDVKAKEWKQQFEFHSGPQTL